MSCKRTARRPPHRLRLTIESLAFGGDAVGHGDDGRVVFVAGAAPGDEVEVEVVEEHKGWLRAELSRVIVRGPARVEPPCPAFLAGCGGCQWQHVAIEAQRAAKVDIVRRALRHVAAPGAVEAIRTPSADYGWRRRARLRHRGGRLGYARLRSHELVDAPTCPQLEPALEGVLASVRAAIPRERAGDVELLVGDGGAVQVAGPAAAAALVGRAGIVSVLVEGGHAVGPPSIDLGDGFRGRADQFAQASAAGNDLLRQLVRELAGDLDGRRVLELHAGSGNFTRDLAGAGARVVAVEESAAAVALAAENLARWADRVTLEARPAEPPLPAGPFELVVVDPPRTGLAPTLAAALAAMPAPIVYVSCDPQTLGRDIAALGRRVVRAVPVDLMPQTFHIEVVALLG